MENVFDQKMEYFSTLLTCGQNLYYWKYDPSLQLLDTSCPCADAMHSFFEIGECRSYLQDYVRSGNEKPLCMSDSLGFSWIAAFEISAEQLCRIHVIGPAFTSDISSRQLEQALFQKGYSEELTRRLSGYIQVIPLTPPTSWLQYGLMLHFSVTGEKLQISDLNYQGRKATVDSSGSESETASPRQGTWLSEQRAMQMIEDGNLDYRDAFEQLSLSSDAIFQPGKQLPLSRAYKNSVISFITLATRAAIRGGLDADTAYLIGNRYINDVEGSKNFSDLMLLNKTMFEDFVQRVHKIKTSGEVSSVVQSCCNYIELHMSEKMTLKSLAQNANYDEYYFAQKFKKEMHVSLSQYIKQQRVAQAKRLLLSTSMSIQDISETLGFCNSSYFSEVFRSLEGCSPTEFKLQCSAIGDSASSTYPK